MEGDLLRREQEFHKINSELEERNSRILQEIDAAKCKSRNHGDIPRSENKSDVSTWMIKSNTPCSQSKSFSLKNDAVSTTNPSTTEDKGIISTNKREIGEDTFAIRSNGLGYEATNRLLRAKLTILNKEVDSLRQDFKLKSEECRRITAEFTHCEEESARLESSLSAARDSTSNLQNKLAVTSQQLCKSQAEILSLNKELASVKKDFKHQKQQTSAIELRLNRALEDIEKLRNAAKQTHLQAKEDRDNQRKTLDQLQLKIKNFERQRTELTCMCTKQSHLIDNLRRQKTHLEVTRFVYTAETEFDCILDWCLKNESKAAKLNS